MMDDLDLKRWQSLWQADIEVPPDLLQKAQKQLRRARKMLIADILVTIGVGGGATVWAMAAAKPSVRALALWIWSTILAAWLFRWFNRPGNWTGTALNTEVFLQKLRSSYRATLRNLKFGWILGLAQILFSSVWVYREISIHEPITIWQFVTLPANLSLWFCIAVVFLWTLRVFYKLKTELAALEQLHEEWIDGEFAFENARIK